LIRCVVRLAGRRTGPRAGRIERSDGGGLALAMPFTRPLGMLSIGVLSFGMRSLRMLSLRMLTIGMPAVGA